MADNNNAFYSSQRSYDDFYSGAMDPNKPYNWTPGALPGGVGYPGNGGLVTRPVTTVPIDPFTGQPKSPMRVTGSGSSPQNASMTAQIRAMLPNGTTAPASGNGLTQQQMMALRNVPGNSYMSPPNAPMNVPGMPSNSQFADTGNRGRASGSMLQQLALAGYFGPSGAAASPSQVASASGRVTMPPRQVANVALPRPRPNMQPPVGANPGTGNGNWFGVEQAYFPPPQVPPPGIEPTVWAGDQPTGVASQLAIQPPVMGPTGTTKAGYKYQNGQRVGVADWARGMSPAEQYATANARGQINAILGNRSGLSTNGYVYQNGQNVGAMRPAGMTPSQQYAQANAAAQARAQSKATRAPTTSSAKNNNGSWATGETSGSPFW